VTLDARLHNYATRAAAARTAEIAEGLEEAATIPGINTVPAERALILFAEQLRLRFGLTPSERKTG
jgi:hypothetical protein